MRAFLISNALFWLKEYPHRRPARGRRGLDAVSGLLAQAGRVGSQPVRRQRESGSHRFPAPLQRAGAHACPAPSPSPRNPPRFPGVSKPVYLNGLGFTMKWNMGWMHDMLDYFTQRPGLPQVPPQQHHLQPAVRVHGEFRAADLARRGGPRQGVAAQQDAGRRMAAVRQRARVPRLHVGASRARSCCSWGRRSGSARSGITIAGIRWELLEFEPHRKLQSLVRELNRLYRANPALYEVDFHYSRLRVGGLPRWENSIIAFLRRGRGPEGLHAVLLQLHARCRVRGMSSACPRRASTRRS